MRHGVLLLCVLCACTRANLANDLPDAAAVEHGGAADLRVTHDLAAANLAAADLAATDLAGIDLATVDLAKLDLAHPPDLARSDLAIAPACEQALASLRFDFEAGTGGFTHAAIDGFAGNTTWPFDEWGRGTPSGPGPGGCHGGTACWGVYLPGNYAFCERAELVSPVLDVSACAATNIKIVFWHWFDFWSGSYDAESWFDGGRVELSTNGGSTWGAAPGLGSPGTIHILGARGLDQCLDFNSFSLDGQAGFTGSSGGAWVKAEMPLPVALRTAQLRVRFRYATGVQWSEREAEKQRSISKPGWYIDDFAVEKN